MLKRLLTLIAILTGLTALCAPAHARPASVENVQVSASGDGYVQCFTAEAVRYSQPAEQLAKGRGDDAECPIVAIAIVVPTVQIHVDRSRE